MSQYEYVGDGRTPVTTSATPVNKRGFLSNVTAANVTANVTWDDGTVELAAIIPPGNYPVWIRSVNTASANNALFIITNLHINGRQ